MSPQERQDRLATLVSSTRFDQVSWVAETGSTNVDLMAMATSGQIDNRVLITDFQSAGQGRKQREWDASPESSLLMSVLLPLDAPAAEGHRWTTTMAVAAVGACAEVAGVTAAVKWPNDLVVGDRKLAGVLAEAVLAGQRLTAMVVGIGMNVGDPGLPPEVANHATSLEAERSAKPATQTQDPVDRVELAAAILNRFDAWSDASAAELREEMLRHSATLGRLVRVELHEGSVVGTVTDIDEEGLIVLSTADGEVMRLTAGDVTHLRPTPSPGAPEAGSSGAARPGLSKPDPV